jgi:pimeloyl-ACP methyl ester carboxylesterase
MRSPLEPAWRGRRLRPGRRLLAGAALLVLALAAGAWTAGAVARSDLSSRYPAPGRLVDVGGYRLHIQCRGQGGPAVVLEAGLDDFSIFWSRVQPGVAKFSRVCAYDRAGTGWSEASPYPRTGETMVRELHTLLAQAGVKPPYVLVGHSFGGALVRQYTYAYPDEVAGLVLVDAAHGELFERIPTWSRATEQMAGFYRALAPLSAAGLLAFVPESIPDRGLPAEVAAQYRGLAVSTAYFETALAEKQSFAANLRALRAGDAAGLGARPLVVVSAGRWEPLPVLSEVENAQAWEAWQTMQSELARLSTHGGQVVAARSGHFVQLEQPELVIAAVREVVQVNRRM